MLNHFRKFFSNAKEPLPGKLECEKARTSPGAPVSFKLRTWSQLKDYLRNNQKKNVGLGRLVKRTLFLFFLNRKKNSQKFENIFVLLLK